MIKFFKSNFFLASVILFFFISYNLLININKGYVTRENENNLINKTKDVSTTFSDVKYKFTNEQGYKFILEGKKAFLSNYDNELIDLEIVNAHTNLRDGSSLIIKSNKAKFYRNKKDILFYENIIITNKDKIIMGENANFYFKKNTIELTNNVQYKDNKNFIKADKLLFNTLTKNIDIKMHKKNKQIYGIQQKK